MSQNALQESLQVNDSQPHITLADLISLMKFIQNLNEMKRLSDLEVDGIKPAFDSIASFINYQEQYLLDQHKLQEQEREIVQPTQTENDVDKSKRKIAKKQTTSEETKER